MKKAILLSSAMALIAAGPALADFPGSGAGGAIPDNNPGGFSSSIIVSETGTITDLDVNIGLLRHSWIGDLTMTLTHVGFGSVTFHNRPGSTLGSDGGPSGSFGDSSNYGANLTTGANYTFDDEGADLLALIGGANGDAFQTPSGNYSHVSAGDLSGFDGQTAAGTWTLTITDHAAGDTGRFENWDLKLTTVPAPGVLALLGVAGLAGMRRRRG